MGQTIIVDAIAMAIFDRERLRASAEPHRQVDYKATEKQLWRACSSPNVPHAQFSTVKQSVLIEYTLFVSALIMHHAMQPFSA